MSIVTDNIMIGPFILGALIAGVILYIAYRINKYRDKQSK